ncbi:MAG: 1-deoxy-D-xylulose-5-phosphate synthase [Firmicutes bacterium]|nr:1-deoxy-D-xylulose-5-phosphate synthase [Bacillota bacterium]
MIDLLKIQDPKFLKELNHDELVELSKEIRAFIIDKVSKTGGHLSSNLGTVELTIALHKVFNSPTDKIIFDVGHQAYTHKILTGRAKNFDQLRQYKGLSGYIKREESLHDVWEAGHSSTAIAALAGFEKARLFSGEKNFNIAVVGDGSLNSGLSFEALNYLGHQTEMRPIIILNDNEMSISKNVGTLSKILNSLRSSKTYVKASRRTRKFPKFLIDFKDRIGFMLRGFAKNMTIFDELGFTYYGPINGHDFKQLQKYFELAKKVNRPTVLHVITKKGKGYFPAESDGDGIWHGVGPFDVSTGIPLQKNPENHSSWSNIVSSYLTQYANNHPQFQVVVPAMINGSGLNQFQELHPNQIIDVGICESFAVCFSGALAMNKQTVFVPIYSSFLQRAYDQISHDIARQDIHVIFGVDRSGLVGDDGETHQGIYDIAYLKHIPNMEIVQPKDASEAYALLDYAFNISKHPIAIRYSRHKTEFSPNQLGKIETILSPSWQTMTSGGSVNLITYGDNVNRMKKMIESRQLNVNLINARFIKPLDTKTLDLILENGHPIVVLEDSSKISSLGSSVLEYMSSSSKMTSSVQILGLPDEFIQQGKVDELYQKYGLDDESVNQVLLNYLKK